MPKISVDIAEMQLFKSSSDSLVANSLGSCIVVAIWDPQAGVGGMLHYMLPESALAPERAKTAPLMFCDTGVPLLFKRAYELGAQKKLLVVKVVGGAHMIDDSGAYNIGKRNYLTLRKLFWKNNIAIAAEDVGGNVTRTAQLDLATGLVTVRTRLTERQL